MQWTATTVRLLVAGGALLALGACGKKWTGAGEAPSASTAAVPAKVEGKSEGAASAKPAASAVAKVELPKGAKAVTEPQLSEMYDTLRKLSSDAKRGEIATAKLGTPHKTSGDKSSWYTWVPREGGGGKCVELVVEPGSLEFGMTSSSKCGK